MGSNSTLGLQISVGAFCGKKKLAMTSPKVPAEEEAPDSSKAALEGHNSLQTTDVGETDLTALATASLGESAEVSMGGAAAEQESLLYRVPPPPPGPPPKARDFHERHPDGLVIDAFPRTISAADVVEAFQGALAFGGPLLDSDESATSLILTLQEWGLGGPDEAPRRQRSRRYDEAAKRGLSSLIQPPGTLEGDSQKFICVFQVGLEDDEEFCLVKRILGKAGNNMRRIADDCNAKVRLRGIGSGFLEGSDGTEANMPLQLNVSCTDYTDYVAAVDQVSRLLKDLYKHYRRYARSKGMEPPDVKLSVEEVRRDDLNLDQFAAKANRSPRERERDRKEREQERRERAMGLGQAQPSKYASFGRLGMENGSSSSSESSTGGPGPIGSVAGSGYTGYSYNTYGTADDEWRTRTLPSGAPMPTTPAGRRAAARTGGAAAAAAVSAAAREAEREERQRLRDEKERRRREAEEKAAAAAKKPSRNAPRGMGLVMRSAGDAQQLSPDGQLPIGANTAQPVVLKGTGKGKAPRKRGGRNRGKGRGKDKSQEGDGDAGDGGGDD